MTPKILSDLAIAQLREVVRQEVRTEVERIVNKTFLDTVKDGADQMEKIFDAVVSFREEVEDLKKTQQLHTESLSQIQSTVDKLTKG